MSSNPHRVIAIALASCAQTARFAHQDFPLADTLARLSHEVWDIGDISGDLLTAINTELPMPVCALPERSEFPAMPDQGEDVTLPTDELPEVLQLRNALRIFGVMLSLESVTKLRASLSPGEQAAALSWANSAIDESLSFRSRSEVPIYLRKQL